MKSGELTSLAVSASRTPLSVVGFHWRGHRAEPVGETVALAVGPRQTVWRNQNTHVWLVGS